jgi:hypothetical protein
LLLFSYHVFNITFCHVHFFIFINVVFRQLGSTNDSYLKLGSQAEETYLHIKGSRARRVEDDSYLKIKEDLGIPGRAGKDDDDSYLKLKGDLDGQDQSYLQLQEAQGTLGYSMN